MTRGSSFEVDEAEGQGAADSLDSESDSLTFSENSSHVSSDYSNSSDSESSTRLLDYESCDEEKDQLYANAQINWRDQTLSVMSYSVKHNLNLSQMTDLLELLQPHCPEENLSLRNVASMS